MGFNVLDASAFYAGVPFRSRDKYCTTSLVYDEIRHIKKNHDALGILLETDRLRILEPEEISTKKAKAAAKASGDFQQMSIQDISVIALAIHVNGKIISDDYAIANVAGNLGISVLPVMTLGIKDVGRWLHYCPGCGAKQDAGNECNICGTPLKRKLLKE
ncbi:MAG: PIN domain-containing protein [Thaumarchaeota archaeon]|nr:PIN domain-containing protein [Nitrososphaerota archaeon]